MTTIEVKNAITNVLPEIEKDVDTFEYLCTIVSENDSIENESDFTDLVLPFIESYGLDDCNTLCSTLFRDLKTIGLYKTDTTMTNDIRLLDKAVSLSTITVNSEQIDKFWGFEAIRNKRNDTMETSIKVEKKSKEPSKLIDKTDSTLNETQISSMRLPDFTGKSREKDIQVNNITISFGGKLLLEGADLKFSYARRYGK